MKVILNKVLLTTIILAHSSLSLAQGNYLMVAKCKGYNSSGNDSSAAIYREVKFVTNPEHDDAKIYFNDGGLLVYNPGSEMGFAMPLSWSDQFAKGNYTLDYFFEPSQQMKHLNVESSINFKINPATLEIKTINNGEIETMQCQTVNDF